MVIRVMTYNISGGRDNSALPVRFNMGVCCDVIKKCSPDIAGLNEVDKNVPRSECCDMPAELKERAGNGCDAVFSKAIDLCGGEYGNMLLSKYRVLKSCTLPVPFPERMDENRHYEKRSILYAMIAAEDTNIEVLITHFGLSVEERKESVKKLTGLIKHRTNPLILMGDFNASAESGELDLLYSLLNDTFQQCSDRNAFTFPSRTDDEYKKYQSDTRCARIDHIFVSDEFTVNSAYIPEECASDHKPYVTELSL